MDAEDNSQTHQLWSNQTNNEFYENLTPEGLQAFAEQHAGLGDGCDLKILTPYWLQAKSILEVGAGYGRVIDYLLAHDFKGKITAVERCKNSFKFLKSKYSENINLIEGDILNINFEQEKFNLILLLWSGIADFSPSEQPLVFKCFSKILSKNGRLIIDTLSIDITPLGAKTVEKNLYLNKVNNKTIYTFSPTYKSIKINASKENFKSVKRTEYFTTNYRKRHLNIIN